MPATEAFSGTPPSSIESVEPQTDAIDVEPFELSTSETMRSDVGPFLDRRDNREQCPLGERAVADLAALRRTHPARLAGGVRREVVVVDVALGRAAQLVEADELLHAGHAEGQHAEHLGLTPLEETGAVGGRQDLHLGRQRPDVGGAAAVDPETLVDDPAADDLLLQRPERRLDLLGAAGEGLRLLGRADHREQQALEDLVEPVVALGLVGDGHRLRGAGGGLLGDRLEHIGVVVGTDLVGDVGDRAALRDDLGAQPLLELDRRLDPLLGLVEAVGDDLLGHLRRALLVEAPGGLGAARLHHHDGDVAAVDHATRDDQLEGGLGALLERGVGDPVVALT